MLRKLIFQENLIEHRHNYKQVFNIWNNLLVRNQDLPLPPCEWYPELADSFNDFFMDKISRIRNNIKDINTDISAQTTDMTKDLPLSKHFKNFIQVDCNDIIKVIKDTPSKSCESDAIPTEILKEIKPQLSPLITAMVNSSLRKGIFPSSLKEAEPGTHKEKLQACFLPGLYRNINRKICSKTNHHTCQPKWSHGRPAIYLLRTSQHWNSSWRKTS